ncbi:MAG: hypothetical protein K2Z81_08985, partial [Cyanobacteria bacterium]|nr:hypothetical protein [Cyanobacteriota bacterium]
MVSNICIVFSIIVLLFAIRCARKGLVLPVMASTCLCLFTMMIVYPVAETEKNSTDRTRQSACPASSDTTGDCSQQN